MTEDKELEREQMERDEFERTLLGGLTVAEAFREGLLKGSAITEFVPAAKREVNDVGRS